VSSELHALRHEHDEEGAARRRWQEAEQAQAQAHEKVLLQLEAAQREVRATHGRAESATHELSGKLRQQRRQWAKEKAALKQAGYVQPRVHPPCTRAMHTRHAHAPCTRAMHTRHAHTVHRRTTRTCTYMHMRMQAEAARARMVEALRHELERLRRERETMPPPSASLLGAATTYHESCCASSSIGGGGGALGGGGGALGGSGLGGALGGGGLGGGGALPAELQRLVAEDRQLQAGCVVSRVEE
jgi:hypothetical protein